MQLPHMTPRLWSQRIKPDFMAYLTWRFAHVYIVAGYINEYVNWFPWQVLYQCSLKLFLKIMSIHMVVAVTAYCPVTIKMVLWLWHF